MPLTDLILSEDGVKCVGTSKSDNFVGFSSAIQRNDFIALGINALCSNGSVAKADKGGGIFRAPITTMMLH